MKMNKKYPYILELMKLMLKKCPNLTGPIKNIPSMYRAVSITERFETFLPSEINQHEHHARLTTINCHFVKENDEPPKQHLIKITISSTLISVYIYIRFFLQLAGE